MRSLIVLAILFSIPLHADEEPAQGQHSRGFTPIPVTLAKTVSIGAGAVSAPMYIPGVRKTLGAAMTAAAATASAPATAAVPSATINVPTPSAQLPAAKNETAKNDAKQGEAAGAGAAGQEAAAAAANEAAENANQAAQNANNAAQNNLNNNPNNSQDQNSASSKEARNAQVKKFFQDEVARIAALKTDSERTKALEKLKGDIDSKTTGIALIDAEYAGFLRSISEGLAGDLNKKVEADKVAAEKVAAEKAKPTNPASPGTQATPPSGSSS